MVGELEVEACLSHLLHCIRKQESSANIPIKLQAGEAGHPSAQPLGAEDTCPITARYVFAPFHITALGLPGERSLMHCHLLSAQATHILQWSI